MIATARLSSYQPLALPGWKTASGGLQPWVRRRVGRTGPQPTGASGKNRPRYDLARQGAVLPQKEQPKPVEKTDIACGVFDDGIGCKRVTYKELCAGASKRRKALTGLAAADTAVVGGSGVIKQLAILPRRILRP